MARRLKLTEAQIEGLQLMGEKSVRGELTRTGRYFLSDETRSSLEKLGLITGGRPCVLTERGKRVCPEPVVEDTSMCLQSPHD